MYHTFKFEHISGLLKCKKCLSFILITWLRAQHD